jgi:hypothetical protein
VILQINSNLTTTTTSRLQLLYDYNPPKFIQKFKTIFLAAISSNTLCAIIHQLHTPFYPTCLSLHQQAYVTTSSSLHPENKAKNHKPLLMHENFKDKSMPAIMALTMPNPSPTLSGHAHLVYWLTLTPLHLPVPSLAKDEHANAQNVTCPDVPGHARARTGTSLDTPEHAPAPLTPTISCPLFSPAHSPRRQLPHRQALWPALTL